MEGYYFVMVNDDWEKDMKKNVEASKDIYNELLNAFENMKKGELIYYRRSREGKDVKDTIQRFSKKSSYDLYALLEIWGDTANLEIQNCMGVQVPSIESGNFYNLRFGEGDILEEYAIGKRSIKKTLRRKGLDSFLGFVNKASRVKKLNI